MTLFQIKAIKPQRLRIPEIRLELLNELRRQGKETEADLGKPVATWENKPKFTSEISLAGGDAMVLTGPTGGDEAVQHFEWVDQGTRPHIIRARRGRRLRFSSKYTAKTRPGWIGSRRGGPSGDADGLAQSPLHVERPPVPRQLASEADQQLAQRGHVP